VRKRQLDEIFFMHYTAQRIGAQVMQKYCRSDGGSILEIGSLDVNGSLRSEAPGT
jgi:hypothetical protein